MKNIQNVKQADASEKTALYHGIRDVLLSARKKARQAINDTMVRAYWQVGRLIVEDEQGGEKRAEYGKRVLPELAKRLSTEFGEGFSAQSLWNYRQFYLEFPILSTAWRELRWSHFRLLMRIKNPQARLWYVNEAANQGWSVRAQDRKIIVNQEEFYYLTTRIINFVNEKNAE